MNIKKNIETIENTKLNLHYLNIENDFGLHLNLAPMPNFSSTYAIFATHFGSIHNTFKTTTDSNFTTVPDGVAHYLEHQLFENEKNHTFEIFSKTGAKTNAFTSYDVTAYFFGCTHNFEKSLQVLLNFVQSPYFTAETVNKERGIIEQELQMYDDDPKSKAFLNLMQALYVNHPVKLNVGGSIESISKIDVDTLNTCYNAFYRLNNMGLLIAGNFDINSTLDVIQNNLKNKNTTKIEKKIIDEPLNLNKKLIKINMSVMSTHFCLGYKLNPTDEQSFLERKLGFELICELLTGEGSNLFSQLYDQNLVSGGTLDYEVVAGENYFSVVFAGTSTNPQKVYDLLNNEIEKAQINGFDEKFFNLVKKSTYCEHIMKFNSVKSVTQTLLTAFILKCPAFKPMEIVSNLTLEKINSLVKQVDLNLSAISIVDPISK